MQISKNNERIKYFKDILKNINKYKNLTVSDDLEVLKRVIDFNLEIEMLLYNPLDITKDETKNLLKSLLSKAKESYEISKQLKTTPSAKGWYPLLIYLFMEDGVYNYTAKNHTVTKILEGDYRAMTGTQDYVANARVNFVMIADFKKKSAMDPDDAHKTRSMYMDTGHCTMGLYLLAASNNMKGVSRAMVDTDKLLELLGLKQGDYVFTLAFSLGY